MLGAAVAGAVALGANPTLSPFGAPAVVGSPSPSVSESASAGATAGATASTSGAAPPTASAPASAAAVRVARAIRHGSRSEHVVALTFDDGYSPPALRAILAILKREHIRATFFPYGWAVANDPPGWHMVVAAGDPIGNHTLSHVKLTGLTSSQVRSQMTHGRRTIDLYSGGTSGDFMRPPGGAYDATVARAVAGAGYTTIVLWDVDTQDWKTPSARTVLARAIRGTNGSIILMHAGPTSTVRALPRIIASYRARGFRFVTIPELLGIN